MDSSCQETTQTHDIHALAHPAVSTVFRTDHILEEICRHLDFNDLKHFRLLSRICNNEARRMLIKRDRHWVVVHSKNERWQLELDTVLRNLDEAAFTGGANSNQTLFGWIFKRFEFLGWKYILEKPIFFGYWGHYLRKIHFNAEGYTDSDKKTRACSISPVINTMHYLLSECCPNLDEMVVVVEYLGKGYLRSGPLDALQFSSPLLKLKCFRLKFQSLTTRIYPYQQEQLKILQRFSTKLVIAAGSVLEKLDISVWGEALEEKMLGSISLNAGISNFQFLQEMTLQSRAHIRNLSRTVPLSKAFPKLTKLILHRFSSLSMNRAMPASYQVFPGFFPALKSLAIHAIDNEYITSGKILYFLQHFPNLEELKISSTRYLGSELPDPIGPRAQSLRSFTFKTAYYDLPLLRCVVNLFPNIVALNLLEFGRENKCRIPRYSFEEFGRGNRCRIAKYSFVELMDAISPLSLSLKQFYVNHAFHTPSQLFDALRLTSNFTALEALILSQAAHDYTEQDFNVSLYLNSSDPEFQYILDCDCVARLKSVRLLNFRFATTEEELENEAAAKGGHVSFRAICPCYVMPWICDSQSRRKPCHNTGWKPAHHP